MANKYKGASDVEELEKQLDSLSELRQQIESKGMSNDRQSQLLLILRIVWGPDGYYTKKYSKSIKEVNKGRTLGYTVVSLSGKMTSIYPTTKSSPYSNLLNEIAGSLSKKISKIKSNGNITK